jgi:pyruvate dehydrogenase E1 component alpha subunit
MIQSAAEECRKGNGPFFLEFITYRWREHCGPNYDNHLGYRTEAEYEAWKKLDPILQLEEALLSQNLATQDQIRAIDAKYKAETEKAFQLAEQAPFPDKKLIAEVLFKSNLK